MRAGEAGLRPLLGALDELGFQAVDAAAIVADFARHLMALFNDWQEVGFSRVAKRWPIDDNGDLLIFAGGEKLPLQRRILRESLHRPSWRDPKTGMPWR
jgi:hypothetical protein